MEFVLLGALEKISEEQRRVQQMRYRDGLARRDIGKTDGATRVRQELKEMVGYEA